MRKASGSKTMLEYFAMLAERVLHDPNSPLHSDELYIPVLEALVASPWLDEWEKIAPEHDLRMALQNRVGLPANDFRYTLASGRTGTLYGIRADYTLVFFNNPDCGMCERIRAEIVASPLLSEMIRAGRLEVLALYPDEDLTAWRSCSAGTVVVDQCLRRRSPNQQRGALRSESHSFDVSAGPR